MKKLLVFALCAVTGAVAYGQGKVNFSNPSTQLVTTNQVTGAATGSIASRGAYIFGLFTGTPGSQFSSLSPVGYATNSALAGRFSGGANFVIAGTGDPAPQIAFQVRGWSVGLGNTWADVMGKVNTAAWGGVGQATAAIPGVGGPGTFLGASSIGSVIPATGTTLTPDLFGVGAGQITGFSLNEVIPIPEPTTIALLGLGLAGFLFIRRRK
jgi:hypothetical protein